jgi:hypothetical protein
MIEISERDGHVAAGCLTRRRLARPLQAFLPGRSTMPRYPSTHVADPPRSIPMSASREHEGVKILMEHASRKRAVEAPMALRRNGGETARYITALGRVSS